MTNSIPNNDEIDLINLIKILWQKKLWIILSTITCIIIGGIYAFTAKEQWTSKAEIIAPQTQNIAGYLRIQQRYLSIIGNNLDESSEKTTFFNSFINGSRSINVKRNFIENLPWFQQQVEGKSPIEKDLLLNKLVTDQLLISLEQKKRWIMHLLKISALVPKRLKKHNQSSHNLCKR